MSTSVNAPSPDQQATATVLHHHAALRRELDEHVRALRTAVRAQTGYEQPLAALTAFLTESVLPHATAEETTLYPAAAADASTALLVEAMTAEHRALTERARALAHARSAVEALAVAEGIAAVFTVHVDKENELLLPALSRAPGVSLAELLQAMHQRLDELEHPANPVDDHADDQGGETPEELDVRTLPHGGGRHEAIFARLDALGPSGRLIIVNDHDPSPLRFQLEAAWPGVFAWEYLQAGPHVWRVAITRRA